MECNLRGGRFGLYSAKCGVWSVQCKVWSVKRESEKSGVGRMQFEVLSTKLGGFVGLKSRVSRVGWRVGCQVKKGGVWSVK